MLGGNFWLLLLVLVSVSAQASTTRFYKASFTLSRRVNTDVWVQWAIYPSFTTTTPWYNIGKLSLGLHNIVITSDDIGSDGYEFRIGVFGVSSNYFVKISNVTTMNASNSNEMFENSEIDIELNFATSSNDCTVIAINTMDDSSFMQGPTSDGCNDVYELESNTETYDSATSTNPAWEMNINDSSAWTTDLPTISSTTAATMTTRGTWNYTYDTSDTSDTSDTFDTFETSGLMGDDKEEDVLNKKEKGFLYKFGDDIVVIITEIIILIFCIFVMIAFFCCIIKVRIQHGSVIHHRYSIKDNIVTVVINSKEDTPMPRLNLDKSDSIELNDDEKGDTKHNTNDNSNAMNTSVISLKNISSGFKRSHSISLANIMGTQQSVANKNKRVTESHTITASVTQHNIVYSGNNYNTSHDMPVGANSPSIKPTTSAEFNYNNIPLNYNYARSLSHCHANMTNNNDNNNSSGGGHGNMMRFMNGRYSLNAIAVATQSPTMTSTNTVTHVNSNNNYNNYNNYNNGKKDKNGKNINGKNGKNDKNDNNNESGGYVQYNSASASASASANTISIKTSVGGSVSPQPIANRHHDSVGMITQCPMNEHVERFEDWYNESTDDSSDANDGNLNDNDDPIVYNENGNGHNNNRRARYSSDAQSSVEIINISNNNNNDSNRIRGQSLGIHKKNSENKSGSTSVVCVAIQSYAESPRRHTHV